MKNSGENMPLYSSKMHGMCGYFVVKYALTSVDNDIASVGLWITIEEPCGRDAGREGGFTWGYGEAEDSLCFLFSFL